MHDGAIRILIVDERGEIRDALRSTLARAAGMAIVHETAHGADLARAASLYGANIAVLGAFRDTSIFLALDQARHADGAIKTILLLDYPDATTIRAALWYGVAGALLRSELASSLATALRSSGSGAPWLSATLMPLLRPPDGHGTGAPDLGPYPARETGAAQPIFARPLQAIRGRGAGVP